MIIATLQYSITPTRHYSNASFFRTICSRTEEAHPWRRKFAGVRVSQRWWRIDLRVGAFDRESAQGFPRPRRQLNHKSISLRSGGLAPIAVITLPSREVLLARDQRHIRWFISSFHGYHDTECLCCPFFGLPCAHIFQVDRGGPRRLGDEQKVPNPTSAHGCVGSGLVLIGFQGERFALEIRKAPAVARSWILAQAQVHACSDRHLDRLAAVFFGESEIRHFSHWAWFRFVPPASRHQWHTSRARF
jgi:hypothetical protein